MTAARKSKITPVASSEAVPVGSIVGKASAASAAAGPTVEEELLAALDAEPERAGDWKPTEPGDTIIGDLMKVEHAYVKKDDRYLPVITVLTGTGSMVRVAVKHQVLRDELLAQEAQTGDVVAIRYLGIPEGKRYVAYRVAVKHDGPRNPEKAFTSEPPSDLIEGL